MVSFVQLLGVGTEAREQSCAQHHGQGQDWAGNRNEKVREVTAGFLYGSGKYPGWEGSLSGFEPWAGLVTLSKSLHLSRIQPCL